MVLYNEEYTFMSNYFPQILHISHCTTSGHSLYLNNHNTSYSPSVLLARVYITQWPLNYCGYTKGLCINLTAASSGIVKYSQPTKSTYDLQVTLIEIQPSNYNSYSHISKYNGNNAFQAARSYNNILNGYYG